MQHTSQRGRSVLSVSCENTDTRLSGSRDYPTHLRTQTRAHTHSYRVFIVDINVLFTQFLRRLRAFFFSYLKRKVEDQRNRKKDSKEGRKRGKEEEWGRTNVRVEISIVKNRRARAAGGEGQRERERGREFATADRRINDVFHSRHFCAVSSPR